MPPDEVIEPIDVSGDDSADLTLIEPRSHFVHAPAMIWAVVDPSLRDQALIPYDRLLKHGRAIRARATGIDGSGATLADDDIEGLRKANQRSTSS